MGSQKGVMAKLLLLLWILKDRATRKKNKLLTLGVLSDPGGDHSREKALVRGGKAGSEHGS